MKTHTGLRQWAVTRGSRYNGVEIVAHCFDDVHFITSRDNLFGCSGFYIKLFSLVIPSNVPFIVARMWLVCTFTQTADRPSLKAQR